MSAISSPKKRDAFSTKVEERGIHGQASDEEVQELVEENIDVLRLPDLPRSDA